MWKEFKKFAFKGNVLDMAVGVVIGGAFGKIVTSVVNDIIMPFFSYVTTGIKFTDLKLVLVEGDPGVSITYGNFIQNIVDFFIIAFSIFLFITLINKAQNKIVPPAEPEPEAPAGPTQEQLLVEIRDLLQNQYNTTLPEDK